MPHTWVGTDFVRSVMDMLAYERESDSTLVLCAGIPRAWVDGDGVTVTKLRTRWGSVSYTLKQQGEHVRLFLDASALTPPPGGIEFAPPLTPPPAPDAKQAEPTATFEDKTVRLDSANGRWRWRPAGRDRTPPALIDWRNWLPGWKPGTRH
jgi:hypothetical protein